MIIMRYGFVVSLAILLLTQQGSALEPEEGSLFVRILDVGAGLSCVALLPNGEYIIYDACDYIDRGKKTFASLKELIPPDSEIALLILGHSDSDHLGAVDEICDAYTVQKIVHAGLPRTLKTWAEGGMISYLEHIIPSLAHSGKGFSNRY
jgi:beta-lactamase superfamily II metal-dependent hydrolase